MRTRNLFRAALVGMAIAMCSVAPAAAKAPQAKVYFLQQTSEKAGTEICVNAYVLNISDLPQKTTPYEISDFTVTVQDTTAEVRVTKSVGAGYQDKVGGASLPQTGVDLYGDFRAGVKYVIKVHNLPHELDPIVAKEATTDTKKTNASGGSLGIQPMIGESTGTSGLKIDASYPLVCLFGEQPIGLSGSVNLEGEFGADDGAEDFDRTFNSNISFEYFPKAWEIGGWSYAQGFRVSPIGIEADQELDRLNYTGKIEYAVQVPFTDRLASTFGMGGDTAATALIGYTYSAQLRDEIDGDTFEPTNRWDTEFVWAFPLPAKFRAQVRWKAFVDLEEGDMKERFIASLRYPLSEDGGTDIVMSYRDGGDAPSFKDEKALRVGLDIKFGDLIGALF